MTENSLRSEPVKNTILRTLPSAEFIVLRAFLTRVKIVPEQILSERGEVAESLYFVERGIVSVRDMDSTGAYVQVACIASEGVLNCECLLGAKLPTFASYVSITPGVAIKLPVAELHHLLPKCPVFNADCLSGILTLITQLAETAASNARDTLVHRCIRLLLILDERAEGEALQVTQETLSFMLGVRRSAVTMAIAGLQDLGFIQTSRGRMAIRDRAGLESQLPGRKTTLGLVSTATAARNEAL